jgi:hypothetical protein
VTLSLSVVYRARNAPDVVVLETIGSLYDVVDELNAWLEVTTVGAFRAKSAPEGRTEWATPHIAQLDPLVVMVGIDHTPS